jgi:hypothetical protein
MIARPVKYDPQDMSISDANHVVICHPFRKIGLPDSEFHKLGFEIAESINGYVSTSMKIGTPQESNDSSEPVKRKRGRPKGS